MAKLFPGVPLAFKSATGKQKATGAGVGMAAMLAIAAPFLTTWEGTKLEPYLDSVGVKTVCIGETGVEMRRYTNAECIDMLRRRLSTDFGPGVAKLAPGIEQFPVEWAAHTSFAYNVGLGTYAKSSVRTAFNRNDPLNACRSMRKYQYAGGRVLAGLSYRRNGEGLRVGEYELCIAGAVQRVLKIGDSGARGEP